MGIAEVTDTSVPLNALKYVVMLIFVLTDNAIVSLTVQKQHISIVYENLSIKLEYWFTPRIANHVIEVMSCQIS